jgi:DNA-directed RNA polymerase specialized sigma24 family protein
MAGSTPLSVNTARPPVERRSCSSAIAHLAEDLVQTALAKVAGRWSRVVARGDPTPYVRTVIVQTAIASRRRRWHSEVPTSPLPELTSAGGDDATILDRRERLRRALLDAGKP